MSVSIFNTNERLKTGVVIVGAAIFLLVPSINITWLMNGSQIGKTFVFLYLIIIMALLTAFRLVFYASTPLRVTILDQLLAMWLVYIIGNGLIHGLPVTLRLLDLGGLVILYILLRQLSINHLCWLFIAFILGGLFQAVHGNLQLWGFIPSNQNFFKVTGSFLNPGPYSGYLANVFITTLGFYIYQINFPFSKGKIFGGERAGEESLNIFYGENRKIIKTARLWYRRLCQWRALSKHQGFAMKVFILAVLSVILLVLCASLSRASFLAILIASFYLIYSRFEPECLQFLRKIFRTMFGKITLALCVLVVMVCIGKALYNLNKDSADGRKLIWTISLNMIRDKPVSGTGFERFKSQYMNYQAAYFKGHTDAEAANIAGDTTYTFNEVLQATAEDGIIGLILFSWILVETLRKKQMPEEGMKPSPDTLYLIAKACAVSVFIFALFSYPSQILPIKTGLILSLATISKFRPSRAYLLKNIVPKRLWLLPAVRLRLLYLLFLFCAFFAALWQIHNYVLAYKDWELASESYQWEDYSASLKYYQKAYGKLKEDGDFLTAYGKALSMAERHNEAIAVLKQAANIYPNTILFLTLGDSYKALRCYDKAEMAYLHAMYMIPSRLFPKYLLVKLYEEWGHKKEATNVAEELLNQPVKVQSTAVREIRQEMKGLIRDHNNSR